MGVNRVVNTKLFSLISYLREPGGASIEKLEEELNISRATVYRYLNILEKEMGLPVGIETRNRKSYYFFDMEDPYVGKNIYENLPYLKEDFLFTKDEKTLLEYLFSNTRETVPSLRSEIDNLHEKVKVLMSFAGHVTNDDEEVNSKLPHSGVRKIHTFNSLPKRSEVDKMDILSMLCDAVVSKRVCTVTYKAPNGNPKTYDIKPLVVFSYEGGFYTIVETNKYDNAITLAIERIQSLEVKDETFEKKNDIDISSRLTDPFGIIAEAKEFKAEIKVFKNYVQYVKDRAWPENRVAFSDALEDGSVIMTVITSGKYELIRWVRYMGDNVQLLGPDWILDELKESIHELDKQYNG